MPPLSTMHTPFSMLHPLAMLHPLYTPYQAHAFTCSTRRGSLGQHFRVLGGEGGSGSSEGGADQLPPPLAAALAILHRFDWVGLTDLYDQSVCLLHYQANGLATYLPATYYALLAYRLTACCTTRQTARCPQRATAPTVRSASACHASPTASCGMTPPPSLPRPSRSLTPTPR